MKVTFGDRWSFARTAALATLAIASLAIGDVVVSAPAPASATIAEASRPAAIDALAAQAAHDRVVSTVPVAWTPQIRDGRVFDIAQVGSTVVVGGSFSQVSPSSGNPVLNRTRVVAFSATNGAINTAFAPSIANGDVRAVEPGPVAGTVYLGGSFQGVNGVTRKVVLVNISTGALVPGFTAPALNGAVNDLRLVGGRLYVGGLFTTVGNQPSAGLTSLNATTGARDGFLSVDLTENHNYTGQPGQAQAGVGAKAIAVTPQGDQMAVVGNFRKADGLERRQMVLIDLTGQTAEVRGDWRTNRYAHPCFSNAFDTYMRAVASSPDGEYFTVGTTGGHNTGSLCDTVTRWNVANTGSDVQPEWTDDTGGDTILSVAASGSAVYAGGHQRWMNNHGGSDYPAPGAVPRPGLGAVNIESGAPIAWNPGRSPRGAGAEAFLVSETGLWVGSDTEQIGHYKYRRPRLAFFPLAGGEALGVGDTGELPANVYRVGEAPVSGGGAILHRVNAGGPTVSSSDGGPAWLADDGSASPYRNAGSNAATWSATDRAVDGTVPAAAPIELFDSERWNPGGGSPMTWSFPVPNGAEVIVRIYLANRCDCTSQVGQRMFDVMLEGETILDDYDIVADVGHAVGTMRSFAVTSDGSVDLAWMHGVENPLVNAIEIVEAIDASGPQAQPTGLTRTWFTEGAVTDPVTAAPAGDIDWTTVRGAVVIDDVLYYGTSDREFLRRTFDGETYGPASVVDPYNDPVWSEISTGSGQTYRGTRPSFYSDIASLSGMAYDSGYLYYTRAGSNRLYSRAFSPDSGVLSNVVRQAPAFSSAALGGVFFDKSAGSLYFVTSPTGELHRVGWDGASAVGTPTVVSGPGIDGVNWRGRALFVADGPVPVPNSAPSPVIGSTCERLDCVFDATQSTDADGSITSYTWDFGDGSSPVAGPTAEHTFAEGDYEVSLTVTDDGGATAEARMTLSVVANHDPVAQIAPPVCNLLECAFDASGSQDPDGDIVDYSWNFGDGSPPVSGPTASHMFTAGVFEVTLTVTDSFGATAAAVVEVVARENQAPIAIVLDPVCDSLSCTFDAGPSSDPDGDAITFAWDFGDGSPVVHDVSTSHTFAATGSYTVTLTVTDQGGQTAATTTGVTVSTPVDPGMTPAEFVGKSSVWALSNPVVTVPTQVAPNDLLIMFVSTNQATDVSPPAGWSQRDRTVSGPLVVNVFTRVADGTEAGASVAVAVPSGTRSDVTLVAYRGVGGSAIETLASAVDTNTATHASPVVTSSGGDRVALTFWADRSSSTTAWTTPEGVEVVSTQVGSGGGRVSTLVTSQLVGVGSYGGLIATTDGPSARGVSMTLLLAPGQRP